MGAAVSNHQADNILPIIRDTIIGLVKQDGLDLPSRQLGILLICYLGGPNTVTGLATELEISKASVSLSLDKLTEMQLVSRAANGRRNVRVSMTRRGHFFIRRVRKLMHASAAALSPGVAFPNSLV